MAIKSTIIFLFFVLIASNTMAKYASLWQGSYTDSRYGGIAYFCVDDEDNIEGSYAEVGIIQGTVNQTHAVGQWYMAGTADPTKEAEVSCVNGNFEIKITNQGFSGYTKCMAANKDSTDYSTPWVEYRLSANIPTDNQCARLDHDGSISYQWIDPTTNGPFWICFTRNGWDASYVRAVSEYNQISVYQGYVEGTVVLDGVAGSGTWYENGVIAGAYFVFARLDGTLGTFKWTGLVGHEGATIIDPFDLADSSRHYVETWKNTEVYPVHNQCQQYESGMNEVLKNLPNERGSDASFFFVSDSILFNHAYDNLFYSTFVPPAPTAYTYSLSPVCTFSFALFFFFALIFV